MGDLKNKDNLAQLRLKFHSGVTEPIAPPLRVEAEIPSNSTENVPYG